VARSALARCPPDPFENEQKYPGVAAGARGKTIERGSYYGYATGVVGLRLFPNPQFDEAAAKAWDANRYYTDPAYYNSRTLVRPYRVGMSCGFCHIGPNPVKPPADPENPKWENLSSNVGAQYFWSIGSSTGTPIPPPSSSSCFTRRGPDRSTPRSSRPTTSTTRGR
jgi:hypothetical protein